MKFAWVLVAVLSIGLISGCVINVGKDVEYSEKWEKREKENRNYISTLALNTSEAEIRSRLGEPDFSEGYSDVEGNSSEPVRILFYRTQRQKEDGITTKEECTPLVFKEGKLVSWGEKSNVKN